MRVPVRAERQVLTQPENVQSGIPEVGNEMVDWDTLIGTYSGILQGDILDEALQNDLDAPLGNTELHVGMENMNDPVQIIDDSHAARSVQHTPPQYAEEIPQEFGMVQKFEPRNQRVFCQKVKSLAELMDVTSSKTAPFSSREPARSHAHIDINQVADDSLADAHQANGYIQGMISSRHASSSQRSYNPPEPPSLGGQILTAPVSQTSGPAAHYAQRQPNDETLVAQFSQRSIQENIEENNVLLTKQNEVLQQQDAISESALGSITTAFSTSNHTKDLQDGNIGIDLNKTLQQKPARRKKYLPKVVVEGKPKKTPKSATKQTSTPGASPAKRSYVRKNGNKTPPPNVEEAEASHVGPAKRSCRRTLNFDLADSVEKVGRSEEFHFQKETAKGATAPFNMSKENTFGPEIEAEASGVGPAKRSCRRSLNFDLVDSAEKTGRSENCHFQKENTNGAMHPFNMNKENTFGPEIEVPSTLVYSSGSMSLNDLDSVAGQPAAIVNYINATRNFSSTQSMYSGDRTCNQIQQFGQAHHQQSCSSGNANIGKLSNERRPWLQDKPQTSNLLTETENQCLKRAYASNEMRKPKRTDILESKQVLHGVPHVRQFNSTFYPWQHVSEVDGNHRTSSNQLAIANAVYPLQSEGHMNNIYHSHSSLVHSNYGLHPSYHFNKFCPDVWKPNYASHQQLLIQQMQQRFFQQIFYQRNIYPGGWSRESAFPSPTNQSRAVTNAGSADRVALRKPTAAQFSSNTLSTDVIQWRDPINKKPRENLSKKRTGSEKQNDLDALTNRLKNLDLNGHSSEKDQYALVPYGASGAIVPHEGFDPVKKRLPRPKVDLDQETTRLWNLLMGKEGSGCSETMEEDKQKWWEEERRVFRGRVDSFIARMHLVQGDRRFSKWKGSVVDSVVGVFLTQNVSDHLSSSAFMCLAAKFPKKVKNSSNESQPGTSSSANHDEPHIVYPDKMSTDLKFVDDLTCNHSSVTTAESFEIDAHARAQKEIFSNNYVVRIEDDVISSQSSSGSLVLHASKDVRSTSGSDSEFEERCNGSRNLFLEDDDRVAPNQQNAFQLKARSSSEPANPSESEVSYDQTTLQSDNTWQCMSIGPEKWQAVQSLSDKHSLNLLKSSHFEVRDGASIGGLNTTKVLHFGDAYTDIGNETAKVNSLPVDSTQGNFDHRSKDEDFQIRKMQKEPEVPLVDKNLQLNPIAKSETGNCQDNRSFVQSRELHPTENEQACLPNKQPNKINSVALNTRKTEKADTSNWDTLRIEAQLKYGTTQRSWDAMDSLDYEALRNAHVNVVSDTIKERGMNNMLAERIKDFLDRLVRDHGKVDLEWLREVPPEKSKDYLLSIRGLGLKSVECVRLLTLHHLAFPVDTNVGRIAVRLGWVPLQPLPESLQLHLLELYPVLETIQKYLWPRLCKLDQETLYELHYQMITFGKVFCTKRDPNCNACPMRGECRHFASAFASARLALPGPQERQLVNTFHPVETNKIPENTIKPMLLPSSMDNIEPKSDMPKTCEPVIEEPTTPELPSTVMERDIEDAYFDDNDEIPVIELNVKEFTTNLQSFLQENMELAEADMSKALVALSPHHASIPVPKLKNISRLRTEHLVYELPDSHPLLEGMDKREIDDPSPYLLAIWSPGETADSFQPPEHKCRSQELGELCFDTSCLACSSKREAQSLTVRGTILIPCRTAMRGSFPLNGTYFQVNEVFADHESSLRPIDVPRSLIWNLPRRTVFFGTSVSSIFKGLSTQDIQHCFWKGFVCVRGFDQKYRAPRPLMARLHFPASKMAKKNE